ncbi:MAG: PLDc N-terminal domain-containing protein [Candidatus Pacearchaeota archaeon]
MGMMGSLFWPFAWAFGGALLIVGLLLLAFWIWMIIDCAKRHFRNDIEKIIWIIVIVIAGWIGALVYFIVIKSINHGGLMSRK